MRTFVATTGDPTGSEYEALLERSTTVQRTPPQLLTLYIIAARHNLPSTLHSVIVRMAA